MQGRVGAGADGFTPTYIHTGFTLTHNPAPKLWWCRAPSACEARRCRKNRILAVAVGVVAIAAVAAAAVAAAAVVAAAVVAAARHAHLRGEGVWRATVDHGLHLPFRLSKKQNEGVFALDTGCVDVRTGVGGSIALPHLSNKSNNGEVVSSWSRLYT